MTSELEANHLDLLQVAVVIPSLNPDVGIVRLINSLEQLSCELHQIIIVDQSGEESARAILDTYEGHLSKIIRVVLSQPGLSKARNAGIQSLDGGWNIVLVPDDDVWLTCDAIPALTSALEAGAHAGSGRLAADPLGLRIGFPETGTLISASNVWKTSIEACYFFTPEFLNRTGLYDESLGLGSGSAWQSGEGTDLLLRGMAQGLSVRYVPEYSLRESVRPPLDLAGNRRRLRNYARGTGRVFARNYSYWSCGLLLARSVARLVIQMPKGARITQDNWEILIGRAEGLVGSVL